MKPSHSIGAFQAPTRGDFASNVGLGWLDTTVTKRPRVQTAVVRLDEKDRDPGAVHRLCHWRARKLEICCSISAQEEIISIRLRRVGATLLVSVSFCKSRACVFGILVGKKSWTLTPIHMETARPK